MSRPASPKPGLLASLLLVPASLLVLLFAAELCFRFVAPAPDIPTPVFLDEVLRHQSGQRGVYWSAPFGLKDGVESIRAAFTINAQGWNSGHADYPAQRSAALRIAIVGDSYVEALQVPPDKSIAEDLERELGTGTEVFRYGVSGAALSQYLHMARRAALPARPDVLVLLLVHNDFDESWRAVPGLYTQSFLRLNLGADGSVAEIPPAPYSQGLVSRLRGSSATWRYLAYGRQVRFEALRRLLLPQGQKAKFEANIDTSDLAAREALDRRATSYLFAQLKAEAAQAGARLLLVMDGVRATIEDDSPAAQDYGQGALRLNRMAGDEAARLSIPFLDLHPVFDADFRAHRRAFAFAADGHWNAYAHALAAHAVATRLRELGWTSPTPIPPQQ